MYFKNNEINFEDKLLEFMHFLNDRNFKFIMSNSFNKTILELFKDFTIQVITRVDALKTNKDKLAKEVIVYN